MPESQDIPVRIADADLTDLTAGDRARARALRQALQRIAADRAPDDPLREMAREVLGGRIGLREAARIPAYAEALGRRASEGFQEYNRLSAEERAEQEAAAKAFLRDQQNEIDQEHRGRTQRRP